MAINSLNAASYGLSGLVSGTNSQEMVQKMLSGTQLRIDKTSQRKSTLQNKQTMYRDVANKLKALQSGFLSFTSGTNLLSSGFYDNMSATVKPPSNLSAAFSATASTNAKVGTVNVNRIEQLAQAYGKENKWRSTTAVKGGFDDRVVSNLLSKNTGTDAKMNIKVGTLDFEIAEAPTVFENMSTSEVAAHLNTILGTAATASVANNKLQITATDPKDFITISGNASATGDGKNLATKMFGAGMANISGKSVLSATIDTTLYKPSIDIDLDGNKQRITIGLEELAAYKLTQNATTAGDLVDSINKSLTSKFGTGLTATLSGTNEIVFTPNNTSQTFTMTGDQVIMGSMGLKAGASNKLNDKMSISDLGFSTSLQGDRHVFNINGVEFSYDSTISLQTVVEDINKSNAGVRISYNGIRDTFKIERKDSGDIAPTSIVMSQTEGNFLSALFGEAASDNITTTHITKEIEGTLATDLAQNDYGWGGIYTFNVNGKDIRVSVAAPADPLEPYNLGQFTEKMNRAFGLTFGFLPDGTQANEFTYSAGEGFKINTNNNSVFKFVAQNDYTNKSNLGFGVGDSNLAAAADTLESLGIEPGSGATIDVIVSGVTNSIAFSKTDTITDIETELNLKLGGNGTAVFDPKTGGFKITSTTPNEIEINVNAGTGAINKVENLFGDKNISINGPATNGLGYDVTDGKNSITYVDGNKIERSSNSFEYQGIVLTLHRTTEIEGAPGTYEQASQIVTERNTEEIVEGIQEFLKLYNETIDYINGLVTADATYKDYPPLVNAQKAEMSENEIKIWEEKSKEGLLRNDSELIKIADAMRKALYTKPNGSAISIYDMGIDTSYYSKDGNFSEKNPGSIKAFIDKDAEAVRKLFAGDEGIMSLLNNAINSAASSSYSTPGSLVQIAGSSSLDTQSSIYKQIKNVDSQLTNLERRYWSEYNRYWKQFNAMEKLIQESNTQSGWLQQQFGG